MKRVICFIIVCIIPFTAQAEGSRIEELLGSCQAEKVSAPTSVEELDDKITLRKSVNGSLFMGCMNYIKGAMDMLVAQQNLNKNKVICVPENVNVEDVRMKFILKYKNSSPEDKSMLAIMGILDVLLDYKC